VCNGKVLLLQVLGLVRCPLYILPNGLGLPGFLRHNFIGSSYNQLLSGIANRDLLTAEEIKLAVHISQSVNSVVSKEDAEY